MIIKPDAEGIFYPDNKNALLKIFSKFDKPKIKPISKLIIVPHAGYEYSGFLAFSAFHYLIRDFEKIFIIAPAIYNRIYGCVTSDIDGFSTPIGNLSIKPYKNFVIDNSVFNCESAITVQLPMIKYIFPEAVVSPILYGCENYKNIAMFIEKNFENNVFVIVSNLSRFIPEREANKLDEQTSRKIFRLDVRDLDLELADGAVGICGAIEFAKNANHKFNLITRTNSSVTNGDTSNVVGYGSWYLTAQ